MERALARQHFIRNHSKRELIRAACDFLRGDLLGRHIAGGSYDHSGTSQAGIAIQQLGDAEIRHLYLTVFIDQEIRGFYIAMDNVMGVSEVQRFRGRANHHHDALDNNHGTHARRPPDACR